jgi:hypothetical protein
VILRERRIASAAAPVRSNLPSLLWSRHRPPGSVTFWRKGQLSQAIPSVEMRPWRSAAPAVRLGSVAAADLAISSYDKKPTVRQCLWRQPNSWPIAISIDLIHRPPEHSTYAQTPPRRYLCDFIRDGARDQLTLEFVYDVAERQAFIIGNAGTNAVAPVVGSEGDLPWMPKQTKTKL